MKTAIASVSVSIFLVSQATATFDNGNQLYQICNEAAGEMLCVGTIVGHYDMMIAWGFRCDGDSRNVTKGQARDIVVKFMQDNPGRRHLPASFISLYAFSSALGCRHKDMPYPLR